MVLGACRTCPVPIINKYSLSLASYRENLGDLVYHWHVFNYLSVYGAYPY